MSSRDNNERLIPISPDPVIGPRRKNFFLPNLLKSVA